MIWNGEPDIESHIKAALQRIEIEKKKPIQQFLRQDVITYTTDAIFVQRLKSGLAHLYTGRKFSDIFVWVSVVPGFASEASLREYMFPQGYCKFFDDLLFESGYDSEDIALMHWTYVSCAELPLLHLAFVADKRHATKSTAQPGGLILPIDLLKEEERKRLGLS